MTTDTPPPPYSVMAPIETPFEVLEVADLKANRPPEANRQTIRLYHNQDRNSLQRFECHNCGCTCTTGCFDVCISWLGVVVLFAIMAAIILLFWLSKITVFEA
ncbi:hypothetical protein OQA88_13383 [Cercophora sp. LCS_1]